MFVESFNTGFVLLFAVTMSACGDEADSAADAGSHHGSGDAETSLDADSPATCDPAIPRHPTDIEVTGEESGIVATVVEAAFDPPRRYFNDWVIQLNGPDGSPLADAMFSDVRTWMPVHLHNGKFVPEIRPLEDRPGAYAFDGVHFTMTGPWQLQFRVNAGALRDRFALDVCVGD